MTDSDTNLLCKQAESYYYDFLDNESCEPVPEAIINHIEYCKYCQEQINQLKETLSQAEDPESEQKQNRAVINEMLKLHFAYIGKPVTCDTVKPFLPCSLDPASEIRIPTPITAHLDNCLQCREDLETLRVLNLSRKQLRCLGQLFAKKPTEDTVNCLQAQAAIGTVVEMDFQQTDAEVLKHLCICPDCRELLNQHRQKVYAQLLHGKVIQKKFPCEDVSATDIFEYCFPYGIDPADDQYAKFRSAFTSHASTCTKCLGKMQDLHKTVCNIIDRPESAVTTVFTIDKSAKAKAVSESGDLYTGFPIKVEVAGRQEQAKAKAPAEIIDFIAAVKRKVSAVNLKPLLKTAIAAAAIILIASVLLLNTSTAGAVSIEQVYKAIEKIKNVYIVNFAPDETELTQERWVSKSLNIYMTKTGNEFVLWDIGNGLRKTKNLDTGAIGTTQLTEETHTGIGEKTSGSLGLMPFYDISQIPSDAEWSRVTDEKLEAAVEGVEVYELKWIKKAYEGSVLFRKWRFFVDPKTNLLQRIENYQQLISNGQYFLTSVRKMEYPDKDEVKSVIKELSF
ncbi:MAG: hypothetical protein ACYS1A_12865 [Planctomycetota bacterium]|jgi:hypothetical protein